jgi:hypothetical protein
MGTAMRHCRVAALFVVAVALFVPSGDVVATAPAPEDGAEPVCRSIPGIVGPEDVEVDRSTGRERLLVSSQDRRGPRKDWPPGEIYVVDFPPFPAPSALLRRLPRVDRDDCSFHPHGMSLVRVGDDVWLLYVINHHDATDLAAGAGCLPVPAGASLRSAVSIEVYRVECDRLRFLRRMADVERLANANDLVALPDGTVWVTAPPPPGSWGFLVEALGGGSHSKLVRFDCEPYPSLRCPRPEVEKVPAQLGRFLNGIAFRQVGDEGRLYVASSGDGRLSVMVRRGRTLDEPTTVQQLEAGAGFDNLSWLDEGRTVLLAAVHPDLRRFLQRSVLATVPSPSAVWRIPVDEPKRGTIPWHDDVGRLLSGGSVAVRLDRRTADSRAGEASGDLSGDLVMGQVFGSYLLSCGLSAAEWNGGAAGGSP